ncbi:MAG TPA: PqiC family protein [Myxococcota bacterium]|nr:PqiC family protein [Myxococcota bacterium]
MTTRSTSRALACLAGLWLAGCLGGAVAPHYYTLRSSSGDAAGPPLGEHPELGLAVGPVDLPRYLDRPELVTQDESNRLTVLDAHRWGGSLRTDILRVVADDLGRLLGTARVAVYPSEPRFDARYRVLLDVRDIQGTPGHRVVLLVRWTVASMEDGRAVAVEESRIEQPVESGDYDALVAADSAAFGTLSRKIADRIAALTATAQVGP